MILNEFIVNVCRKYHVLREMIKIEAHKVIDRLKKDYVP